MRLPLVLCAIAACHAQDDSSEDYQDPPYVRPPKFKPCDLGELDKFLPGNIRTCAIQAAQGAMPIGLMQQSISMLCKMFKKCQLFIKKGKTMVTDDSHHCLHGFVTELRKSDVTGEAIELAKNIIMAKDYVREKVIAAVEAVVDCVDKGGYYLPVHKHHLLKLVGLNLQLLE